MVINVLPISTITVNGQTIQGGNVELVIPGGVADPNTGEITFPPSTASRYKENFTLTNLDISNKYLLVTNDISMDEQTEFKIEGLAPQFYGESFVVDGVNKKKIKWDSLALDGLLQVGDEIEIFYI